MKKPLNELYAPNASWDEKIFRLMYDQAQHMRLLVERLAPGDYQQKIQFLNVAAGTMPTSGLGFAGQGTGLVRINNGYNGIIADITAGQLNLSFGSIGAVVPGQAITTQPDLHFGVTSIPGYSPWPLITGDQITLWADANAGTVTTGTLYLVRW